MIAINSGSENNTALQNEIYEPDRYFQGGQTRTVTSAIAHTNEPTLFQSERYGSFSYAIPVTSARYSIKLQLAELYWSEANKRVFSIAIEGSPVISALDIFTSVGASSALTKIIDNIAVTDGVLNIDITSEIDNGTLAGLAIYSALGELSSTPTPATVTATNPLIWADVPDPSVLRMGDTYYMSSTTMHMNPGIPIMRSKDLVQWETINYAYETLESGNAMTLSGGQDEYGRGSWASSLVYNAGTYYVSTFSNAANKTYIFTTNSLENGPWERNVISGAYHDSSLFFDNGRLFFVYGSNTIKIIELTPDGKSIKSGGLNQILIANASSIAGASLIVPAEGTHAQKINGQYYISLICWPNGGGRTQLLYKSSSLTGPYEGRVVLKNDGIAQGGFIDTADGAWYAFLFQDHGSVGRIPYLVPVKWNNGWPTLGNNGVVPSSLDFKVKEQSLTGIVSSDDFTDSQLKLAWQWNHNPDKNNWSLTAKPGFLRLTTARVDQSILTARNSLTQRSFGPESTGIIAVDITAMKDGDVAGLAALQKNYGYVGVKINGNTKSVVMVDATSGSAKEISTVSVNQTKLYFKIRMDFKNKTDKAYFYYSLDGTSWKEIGNAIQMSYTLPHFIGYRYALFNYATKTSGGFVDFDYYKVFDGVGQIN